MAVIASMLVLVALLVVLIVLVTHFWTKSEASSGAVRAVSGHLGTILTEVKASEESVRLAVEKKFSEFRDTFAKPMAPPATVEQSLADIDKQIADLTQKRERIASAHKALQDAVSGQ